MRELDGNCVDLAEGCSVSDKTLEDSLLGLSSRMMKLGEMIIEQSEIPFIDEIRRRKSKRL